MSSVWPAGNDGTLLKLITDYVESLSKNSSVDEASREQLTVAADCLMGVSQSNNLQASNVNGKSLADIYDAFAKQANLSQSNDNSNNQNNSSNDNNNNSSMNDKNENESKESENDVYELAKRLGKFDQFVKVLKSKNFFKGNEEGSEEYLKLLDNARKQWNQRFPQFELNNLSLITKERAKLTEMAEKAKGQGNQALQKKDFKNAIAKYTEAIKLNPNNAIYYSNRSAAYCHTKDYVNGAKDARQATKVDGKYVKAWVRLGVSEFELGNFEEAREAYDQALKLTPSTDKNWETYMERVQICEQKMHGNDDNNEDDNNDNDMTGMGGGQGGQGGQGGMPDFSSLLGGMGGGGNNNMASMLDSMGGMEGLSKLMQNPMMQQMANQFMQDPNMMQNLQNMMGNPQAQEAMQNMMGGQGQDADDVKDSLSKLLQDPEKAQAAMKKAMDDPEMKELMKDESVAKIANRIKGGDYTALMEASKKPELIKVVRKCIKKYAE